MFTRKKVLVDTDKHSLIELFGDLGLYDNLIVQSVAGNTETFFAGDAGQLAVELPVGTIGFNFGGSLMREIFVQGAIGDTVTIVGLNNG